MAPSPAPDCSKSKFEEPEVFSAQVAAAAVPPDDPILQPPLVVYFGMYDDLQGSHS